jgi:RNA polymerase sigma-70 factor (ECF subfamily)
VDLYSFDDEYVRRLAEGDRTTEEHFLRYFQEMLLIKLRGRVRSLQEIDDIRQETFLRVLRILHSPEGVQDGRKLGALVNGVCNNVMKESGRSAKRSESLPAAYLDIPDPSIPVDELLATAETKAAVRRILDSLPRKDADILRAIFLEDRDKDEICRVHGVDREYLRVLVHRAKDRFRRGASVLFFRRR